MAVNNERDLTGYGGRPPHPQWPGRARLALQFVLNLEEGAESCVLNGDSQSEAYLHELVGRPARLGERDLSVESLFEYGARAGAWRLLALFDSRQLPLTVFACGLALELNPDLAKALVAGGHELAGHGYRWLDHHPMALAEERRQMAKTQAIIQGLGQAPPLGWYTGRISPHSRQLAREAGCLYSSDCYNDDLPYWLAGSPPLLMIPYSLVSNDIRYLQPHGAGSPEAFYGELKDAFDCLWQEGAKAPKMMTVGLHGRISGQPARAQALARFLDYVQQRPGVWVCRRQDIARHWQGRFPAPCP
ncbi:polysaccharide deacetylase family protein [Gallaecimonas xiamenensis]|uniref:Polysaccharide deacetylase family protein n=1 Tax=Gallaecimonas xiamenensis 3-C-1 TaxID=745411 RepID=K2KH52_9GAMM|nr:polysaccharide deacetylase family protein [Gallaecimonas xiamenensis]EKE76600.1 polysaccharide deacetylase family protein [Gallaecimonas xiamenensis 3-C-1]